VVLSGSADSGGEGGPGEKRRKRGGSYLPLPASRTRMGFPFLLGGRKEKGDKKLTWHGKGEKRGIGDSASFGGGPQRWSEKEKKREKEKRGE